MLEINLEGYEGGAEALRARIFELLGSAVCSEQITIEKVQESQNHVIKIEQHHLIAEVRAALELLGIPQIREMGERATIEASTMNVTHPLVTASQSIPDDRNIRTQNQISPGKISFPVLSGSPTPKVVIGGLDTTVYFWDDYTQSWAQAKQQADFDLNQPLTLWFMQGGRFEVGLYK